MSRALLALGPTIFRMALRSLRANRLRSLLTLLGIVIGVAMVVAMASIIQGFNHTVTSSLGAFGSNVIYIRKLTPDLFLGALAFLLLWGISRK